MAFSLFSSGSSEKQLCEKAKAAFDKVSAVSADSDAGRSAKVRMALLCRAHIDKAFISAAKDTELYQDASAVAAMSGKEKPEAPTFSEFQKIESGGKTLYTYLPEEYCEKIFILGSRYQRAEISALEAIQGVQKIADQIFKMEFKLEDTFLVLQFLRDELAESNEDQDTDKK